VAGLRLAEEVQANGLATRRCPTTDGELERIEMCFKEALRLVSPVPVHAAAGAESVRVWRLPRIPAGVRSVSPMLTHQAARNLARPRALRPDCASRPKIRGRHKYAWVPFGGGAHMCLGLHFAYLQAKAFFYQLLGDFRITAADGYQADFQMFPIPKPRDGLPIRLERIRA
jgi:cytochrome P450